MDLLAWTPSDVLAMISLGLTALALVLMTVIMRRQRRMLKQYRALLNGPQGQDLDLILAAQAAQLEQLTAELQVAQADHAKLAQAARKHLSRVGVVRFNPFPEMGSDLSFAVALLDEHDNGVVVSSLYSRSESRVYAKPIADGKSTYTLTDEERQAIGRAGK